MKRGHSYLRPSATGLPSQPWCIGSMFPAVPLISSSSSCSPYPKFFFELRDDACVILQTGSAVSYDVPSPTQVNPQKQVKRFLSRCVDDFFPREPLVECLDEDHWVNHESKHLSGNCLDGIQNMGGHIQLFFPVGPNNRNLGSCAYFPNSHGSVTSGQDVLEEPHIYSSPISKWEPIVQITADKSASCSTRTIPLAARTLSQVHCLTCQMEDDHVLFNHSESQRFRHRTSHVVWNSHIPGEAAVMLENGDINIIDFKSGKFDDPCFMVNMKEDIDEAVSGCSDEVMPITLKKRKKKQKLLPGDVTHGPLSRKWTCEYGWHPKNLIVAGKKKLFLVDLRQRHGKKQMYSCIADSCATGLASYCNQLRKNDNFTSISRADYDGMFQFSAASTYHVLLYDIRQPKTPLIQWEHRTPQYPPEHLQMYCMSDLCSSIRQCANSPIMPGRVILGHSFKSGDVHAFFYGPHSYPDSSLTTLTEIGGRRQRLDLDSIIDVSSWQFPVKLRNPKLNMKSDIERKFKPLHLPFEFYTPESNMESVFGVFNFSPSLGARNFTMLQLTGKGCITSQNYEVSEKLDSRNFYKQAIDFQQTSAVRQTEIRNSEDYTLEHVPSFLDHIRYGLSSHTAIESSSKGCYHGKTAKHAVHDISNKLNEKQNNNNEENIHIQKHSSSSRLDDDLCPIMLSFKENDDLTLPSRELDLLIEFKGQLQQWLTNYQPFLNYCNSRLPNKSGNI